MTDRYEVLPIEVPYLVKFRETAPHLSALLTHLTDGEVIEVRQANAMLNTGIWDLTKAQAVKALEDMGWQQMPDYPIWVLMTLEGDHYWPITVEHNRITLLGACLKHLPIRAVLESEVYPEFGTDFSYTSELDKAALRSLLTDWEPVVKSIDLRSRCRIVDHIPQDSHFTDRKIEKHANVLIRGLRSYGSGCTFEVEAYWEPAVSPTFEDITH